MPCRPERGCIPTPPAGSMPMPSLVTQVLLPFALFWLIYLVAIYVVTEFAQNYFYDETTPAVGFKVLLASALLAGLQTWARTSFDSMFTGDLGKTLLQAIAWFAVFTLILRYHPPHAFAVGVLAMVIATGASALAVDSLRGGGAAGRTATRAPSKPLRKSIGAAPGINVPKDAEEKAEAKKEG